MKRRRLVAAGLRSSAASWIAAGAAVAYMAVALASCGGSPQPSTPSTDADAGARGATVELQRLKRERRRLQMKLARQQARQRQGQRQIATPEAPSGPLLGRADRASFARLAAELGGRVGLAVSVLGRGQPVTTIGDLRSGVAWSTAKVPIASAVIASGLAPANRADLRRSITASDNAAALRLWQVLGGGTTAAAKATEEIRAAGDERTIIQARALRGTAYTPFGQTGWDLADQVRYVAGLECSAPGRLVVALMRRVIPSQRWGLGSLSGNVALKGGWGPGVQPGMGGAYLDRQMGIVALGNAQIAVAIAAAPEDGSHATGIAHLTALAKWLANHLHAPTAVRARCY